MRSAPFRFLSRWLGIFAAMCLFTTEGGEIPAELVRKAQRLVLCEEPELNLTREGFRPYKLTPQVVAEGAECTALLGKLTQGKDGERPGAGLGYLAYVAALDGSGNPILLLAIYCQAGDVCVENSAMQLGEAGAYALGKKELVIKSAPEFARGVYEYLKKQDPARIRAMDDFYKKMGTTLEELLFADGFEKLVKKSRK
jgi:hypothetical protein